MLPSDRARLDDAIRADKTQEFDRAAFVSLCALQSGVREFDHVTAALELFLAGASTVQTKTG